MTAAGLVDLEMSCADVQHGLALLRRTAELPALHVLHSMLEKVVAVPGLRGMHVLEDLMAEPCADAHADVVASVHLAALGYSPDQGNRNRWIELVDDFVLRHPADFVPILGQRRLTSPTRRANNDNPPNHQPQIKNHGSTGSRDLGRQQHDAHLADDDQDHDQDHSHQPNPPGYQEDYQPEVYPIESPERYIDLGAHTRVRLLLALFEKVAFDFESAFSTLIAGLDPEALRKQPIGYDAKHNAYWLFTCDSSTTRLYREPDPSALARAERAEKAAAQKAARSQMEFERVGKKRMRQEARKEREAKMQAKWKVRPAAARRTRASIAAAQETLDIATLESTKESQQADEQESKHESDAADEPAHELDDKVPVDTAPPPATGSSASHRQGFLFDRCSSWELVAKDADELRSFIADCLSGKRSQVRERQLRSFLEDEALPAFETAERKRSRATERRDRDEWYSNVNPKKSARVLALEQRRAEEERLAQEREAKERERLEEDKRRRAERKAELEKEEKEQRRLARMVKRDEEFAAQTDHTLLIEDGQPNDRPDGEGNGPTAATGQKTVPERKPPSTPKPSKGTAAPRPLVGSPTSGGIDPAQKPDFANERDIPAYFNWDSDEKGFPNRHLDKIRVVSPDGEMSRLEVLDDADSRIPSLVVTGELKPPPGSGQSSSTARIAGLEEWCIEYGSDPAIWARAKNAWYRLYRPRKEYRSLFFSARRKLELCNRLYLLSQELVSEALTMSRALELLGNPGERLRAYKEGDLLIEGEFILSQIEGLDSANLKSSPLARELSEKIAARRKKRQNPSKYKTRNKKPRKPNNALKSSTLAQPSASLPSSHVVMEQEKTEVESIQQGETGTTGEVSCMVAGATNRPISPGRQPDNGGELPPVAIEPLIESMKEVTEPGVMCRETTQDTDMSIVDGKDTGSGDDVGVECQGLRPYCRELRRMS